jgi:hypothetical protein
LSHYHTVQSGGFISAVPFKNQSRKICLFFFDANIHLKRKSSGNQYGTSWIATKDD